jgi:dTMP kinase
MPALERGEVVITDRYVDSMLAYQGAGRTLDVAEVDRVARWATRDLRPHLTVVLDLDPEHGLGRFDERDRIEGESLDFFVRAREAFLTLAAADPDHYLVVDAVRAADEISDVVLTRVEPLLSQAAR